MTTTPTQLQIGNLLPAARPWRGKRSVFLLEAAPEDARAVEVARTFAGTADDLDYWRAKAITTGVSLPDIPLQQVDGPPAERTRLTLSDRYGEIVAVYEQDFPSAQELVEWAKFLEISCGACSTPS